MFKKDMLLPFIIIFVILAIFGSIFKTYHIVLVTNGVSYYGIPFTSWSKYFFSNPYTYKFYPLGITGNIVSWLCVSYIFSRLYTGGFKKRTD